MIKGTKDMILFHLINVSPPILACFGASPFATLNLSVTLNGQYRAKRSTLFKPLLNHVSQARKRRKLRSKVDGGPFYKSKCECKRHHLILIYYCLVQSPCPLWDILE